MKCNIKSIEGEKKAILTGICQRNRFRVNISEEPADRRKNGQQDRAGGANDHGVEDGGFLVGGPAEVAEGGRPELRLRHCDGLVGSGRAVEFRGFPSCLWRDSGRKRSIEQKRVTGDEMLRFARFPFPSSSESWGVKTGQVVCDGDRRGEKVKSKLESDDKRRRSWHRSPISPNTSPVHTSRPEHPLVSLVFPPLPVVDFA